MGYEDKPYSTRCKRAERLRSPDPVDRLLSPSRDRVAKPRHAPGTPSARAHTTNCPIAADRTREPEIPRTWSARSFWQRSKWGNVPVVGGERERDDFHGDEAQRRRLTLT